ncbi:chemotaxis protein CheA [Sphingomonas koreensis]|nr:chemotaxis protein CheA [Sphingomonas koreensis]
MDDLLQEFIAETRETMEALSGEIIAWEADPSDRARLDAIFRFVHTVKGSCGFLDLPRLARLSHAAEDVLSAVRSGERAADTHLVNAVLAIVDRIGEIVEAIDGGVSLDDGGEDMLIAALDGKTEAIAHVAAPAAQRAPTRSVRLSVDLLDRMMSGMSEMVLARNELARRLRDDADPDPAVEASLERLSLTVAEMRDTVTRTRMQKIDALFSALPRMVRDTAAGLGKSVALSIDGADVELDREMIEMMRDPLGHIIRNSIDHGIETPAERRIAGKRENGTLSVSARQSGNQIIVEIIDDGRGIDTEKVIRKLVASGAHSEAELRALSDKARLDLVFEPGLTTKDEVTAVSGRGVGMDVVRANIEQIGGRIELSSVAGKGLRTTIHVPLTLSIISAIVIGVGAQRFAITRQSIEEIVRVRSGGAVRIDRLGSTAIATVRERRLPLIDLAALLGIAGGETRTPDMLVIIGIAGGSFALAVDSVLDNEELVIKPASPAVMASGCYAGQTLPDSGLPMLLLDSVGIAAAAGVHFGREAPQPAAANDQESAAVMPALLFMDLDGVRRAAPLAAIDRVEPIAIDRIQYSAGQLRLSVDDRLIPLAAQGSFDGRSEIAVLRLTDGDHEIGYAIGEALDIADLPCEMTPAREPGPVAGVLLFDGEQIELLDPHWLFAQHVDPGLTASAAPLCLLSGRDAGWMATFLRPALERAGYRVATSLKPGERAALMLAMDDDPETATAAAPVLRLRRDRRAVDSGSETIYRYDRTRLSEALARHAAGAR